MIALKMSVALWVLAMVYPATGDVYDSGVRLADRATSAVACEFGNDGQCVRSFWLEHQTLILTVLGVVGVILLLCCACCYCCCCRKKGDTTVILPYSQFPVDRSM